MLLWSLPKRIDELTRIIDHRIFEYRSKIVRNREDSQDTTHVQASDYRSESIFR
jgi:hypothetical protein